MRPAAANMSLGFVRDEQLDFHPAPGLTIRRYRLTRA
jgi:hypothetical protein